MPFTILLCTDGSDIAAAALADGLAIVRDADRTVLVTVVDPVDPMLVVGTGMAGGVMSPVDATREHDARLAAANDVLETTRQRLGRGDIETLAIVGSAGPAICELAASLPASVIVIGTRGLGGVRRAVLGSVSDHVVRNAPCAVLTRSVD